MIMPAPFLRTDHHDLGTENKEAHNDLSNKREEMDSATA